MKHPYTPYRGGGPRDQADRGFDSGHTWKADLIAREPIEPAKGAPEAEQRIYLSNRAAYYERETTRLALQVVVKRDKAEIWRKCCIACSAFAGTMVVGLFVILTLLRGKL